MSKTEAKFERKGATIKNLETNQVQSFTCVQRVFTGTSVNQSNGRMVKNYKNVTVPSINAAKRESRKIQGANLGNGLLRVA